MVNCMMILNHRFDDAVENFYSSLVSSTLTINLSVTAELRLNQLHASSYGYDNVI